MAFDQSLLDELKLLARFDVSTTTHGIKVSDEAGAAVTAAVRRLFDKGLVTEVDGGYLTQRGIEAQEYLQHLKGLMQA